MITSAHENLSLMFDRGYGKLYRVDTISMLKFNINTIATTVGSSHSLIPIQELKTVEGFWFEKSFKERH